MLWLRTDVATVEFADRVEPGIRHRYLGLVEALGEHLVWRQSGAAVQFLRVCPRSGRQYVFDDLRSALEAAAFSDTGKVEYEAMPKR